MSGGEIIKAPAGFAYAQAVSIVCPKCGHTNAVPIVARHGNAIEYAGVCGAIYAPRSFCDAVVNVRVTSHVFPA